MPFNSNGRIHKLNPLQFPTPTPTNRHRLHRIRFNSIELLLVFRMLRLNRLNQHAHAVAFHFICSFRSEAWKKYSTFVRSKLSHESEFIERFLLEWEIVTYFALVGNGITMLKINECNHISSWLRSILNCRLSFVHSYSYRMNSRQLFRRVKCERVLLAYTFFKGKSALYIHVACRMK